MNDPASRTAGSNELPADVHADLVETLFGTVGSFVSGLVGGLIVPVIAWFRTGDPVFLVCTGTIIALSCFRVAVLLFHNRESEETRRREAGKWEAAYALGGVSFMTAVGITAAILLERQHDELTGFYGIVIMMGMAGALAARNAGRPLIVFGQVLGVCGPVALTLLFRHDAWYWGLAGILVLVMSSVKSTTRFLNDMLLSALLNGREARIQRTRFSTALDSMSHGLCMADHDGRISVANHRLLEAFGLGVDVVGLTVVQFAERIVRANRPSMAAGEEFIQGLELHATKRDSCVFTETISNRIYDFRCEPMETGGVVIVVEDVTEARRAAREVERMAAFDTLTGLPNRHQFQAYLRAAMDQVAGSDKRLAVLSIDLDQFKEVNDTLGHPVGDKLLCEVADRLQGALGQAEVVARFGGDEFIVLLQPAAVLPNLDDLASQLVESVSAQYVIDGHMLRIGCSIGIAQIPSDASTMDDLLKCADLALYHAKASGRGTYRHFDPVMDVAMRRKRDTERELREALARGHLEVHYQPVVDIRTQRIVSCEALVRWRHPERGLIFPGDFISIAEETGLIVQVGEFVLQQACQDARAWPEGVRVAVNFSAKQFSLSKDLAARVVRTIAAAGLEPERLEVEITESTLMETREARKAIAELSDAKIRICLDDFGTGYSSLSYLQQFPVQKIKIDRCFIRKVDELASQAVIGSIAFLARTLDIEVVMEGVETQAQLSALKPWSVHLVQGFLFSPAIPQSQLLAMFNGPLLPAEQARRVA